MQSQKIIMLLLCLGITIDNFAQNVSKASVIELVDKYLNAAFNQDYEQQRSLMHDSIVDYHPTVLQKPAKGKAELIKGWQESFQNFDSVEYINHGIGKVQFNNGTIQGNWVLTVGELQSNVKGSPVKSQMIGLYRLRDDLIIEVKNYGNLLDIYMQLGYTLQRPKK